MANMTIFLSLPKNFKTMKIISEVPNNRYLVIVTDDELANIVGDPSHYTTGFDTAVKGAIKNESDIQISIIYKKHSMIQDELNSRLADKARAKLQKMLDTLTPIENLIKDISKLDTPEEAEKK